MSSRFILPFADVGSGIKPSDGAQLFFFDTGTSTPRDTFSDQLSTPTPNANPVIADSTGVFSDIFINGAYKVVLKDKNDVQIWEADPVESLVQQSTISEDNISSATAPGASGSEGDFVRTNEYVSGTGEGGGLYKLVSADPGFPLVNPIRADGLWLSLVTDGPVLVSQAGGSDDTAANAAIQYANSIGLSVSHDGDLATTGPIDLTGIDGLDFIVSGNINNSAADANSNGIILQGSFGRGAQSAAGYYACNLLTGTSTSVTTTAASAASNFSVDDFVFIRGGSFFTTGGDDVYAFGLITQVESSDSGTGIIGVSDTIKGPISSSLQITNVTGLISSNCNVKCRDAISSNPTPARFFMEGGGSYRCNFETHDVDCRSWSFGNAFNFCTIKSNSVHFVRDFFELGVNSGQNLVQCGDAVMSDIGVVGKRVIRQSEGANNNRLIANTLNMDSYSVVGDVPIYLEGFDNTIEIGDIYASNVPGFFGQFVSQAFTPTAPVTTGNTFSANVHAGGGTRYWNWTGATTNTNTLKDCEFDGAVSSGAATLSGDGNIIDNVSFEQGLFTVDAGTTNERIGELVCTSVNSEFTDRARSTQHYKGNEIGDYYDAVSRDLWISNLDVTSLVPGNVEASAFYLVGRILSEDQINFLAGVDGSGVNGARTVEIIVTINAVPTTVFSAVFAIGESDDLFFSGVLRFSGTTTMLWSFEASTDAAIVASSVGGLVVADIEANDVKIDLVAYMDDALDSLRIRTYSQQINRVGI